MAEGDFDVRHGDDPVQALLRDLINAVEMHELVEVERLLRIGAPVDAVDSVADMSPLMQAVDVECDGFMQAAVLPRTEIIERLIEHGADCDKTSRRGHSARSIAERYGIPSVLHVLGCGPAVPPPTGLLAVEIVYTITGRGPCAAGSRCGGVIRSGQVLRWVDRGEARVARCRGVEILNGRGLGPKIGVLLDEEQRTHVRAGTLIEACRWRHRARSPARLTGQGRQR